MRRRAVCLIAVIGGALGCGGSGSSREESDASVDDGSSTGVDATMPDEGGAEDAASAESGPGGGDDAMLPTEDAEGSGGPDDAGSDADNDSGSGLGPEAGSDAGFPDGGDAGTDASLDAGPEDAGSLLPICSDAGLSLEDGGTGVTYFVAPGGSDGNSGTLAAPFATVQHCANVAQPGSTCYLRAGTYRESVVPPRSGTASAPITFQAYPCELPVVSGTEPVTGWAISSGSVYVAPLTTVLTEYDGTTPRTEIFVDGKPATLARWPNVTTTAFVDGNDEATAGTGTTATSIVDPSLSSFPTGTWNGAVIHVLGGAQFTSLVGTVTQQTGTTLTVNLVTAPYLEPEPGSRYHLANLLSALDAPGEWYADGGHVHAWMPASDSPSAHIVEAKQRDWAFDLSGLTNVVVRGIELFGASINTSFSSASITIDSLVAAYPSYFLEEDGSDYYAHGGNSGIQLLGTNNVLENSEIFGSTNDGVVVQGSGSTVTNCLIHDIDSMAVYASPILLVGSGHHITHNTLYATGRDGLHVNGGTTSTAYDDEIAYNDIYDYGMLNKDLGGIYGVEIDWSGSVVHHNWVHDIALNVGSGIYFDNESTNATAHHNVVWNTGTGFTLNGVIPSDGGANYTAPSMFIYNNTVGPSAWAGTASVTTYPTPENATGSRLINDIFADGPLPSSANFSGVTIANDILPGTNPMFVSVAAADFQLAPGSPAIGAGQVISGVTTTNPPDIGAYEGGPFAPGCNLPGCH